MIKIICIIILATSFFASCKNENKVKARIFERKETQGNQLKIKYNYLVKGQGYIDSAIVNNTIIEHDTIDISVEAANPKNSKPIIETE